jgi:hypothetical protein
MVATIVTGVEEERGIFYTAALNGDPSATDQWAIVRPRSPACSISSLSSVQVRCLPCGVIVTRCADDRDHPPLEWGNPELTGMKELELASPCVPARTEVR